MAKQIYIDENGNPIEVSGTINTAELLPISGNDPTDTKSYIDNKVKSIHSVVAGSAISTQDIYQIPSDYLTKSDVIIIEAHRYSEGGSIIVPVSFITSGYYSAGFYIRASKNNGWTFTVSTSGEIALLFKDGTAGDPVMSIVGWW